MDTIDCLSFKFSLVVTLSAKCAVCWMYCNVYCFCPYFCPVLWPIKAFQIFTGYYRRCLLRCVILYCVVLQALLKPILVQHWCNSLFRRTLHYTLFTISKIFTNRTVARRNCYIDQYRQSWQKLDQGVEFKTHTITTKDFCIFALLFLCNGSKIWPIDQLSIFALIFSSFICILPIIILWLFHFHWLIDWLIVQQCD